MNNWWPRLAKGGWGLGGPRNLIVYFKCGYIYKRGNAFNFMVTKFSDIVYKIIPFFNKYPIEGVKGEYFNNFYKVAEMMKKKNI